MIKNFLIIGCGLIGSSVLRTVSKKRIAKKIFVFEKSKKNISKIKKLKIRLTIVKDLKKIIPEMDMIIFCTPMSEYEKILIKINSSLNQKSIITDVGSTKAFFFKSIKNKLKKNVTWISSHPIAGSEVSGPEYGTSNLFFNKWCILIADKNTRKKNLNFLIKFWKSMGSKVSIMDAKKHDSIFSITSHLPHLIAYNLIKTTTDFERQKKYNLIQYSAGGLRDFSRIAASNEIMWRDIFFSNKDNLSKSIDLFIKNLKSFKKNIKSKNNKLIISKLIEAKKVRRKIIKLKQDINKPDFGRD